MSTGPNVVIPEPPECANGFLYTVRPGDSLFLIARRFGVRLEDLIAANPQITDPNRIFPGQRVCVPVPAPPMCPNGFLYTVVSGDTMFRIAQRFGVTLEALIAANPQITDPNMIFPGQRICVPIPPEPACPNGFVYTVVSGDTLFRIAQRFGVTLEALIAANPQITDPNVIFPGQKVCVPIPGAPPCTGMLYTVKAGDTMFKIAQAHGVTLQALIAANPQIVDPNKIFPGQVICIPAASMMPSMPPPSHPQFPPPPPCPGGTIYTVVSGDTLWRISRRFGISLEALIAANPQITNPDLIFPGQRICVPRPMEPPAPPMPPIPPAPPCPNGFIYTVQSGDSLFKIAQRFGVSLQALIAANPQIPDPNLIFPGQRICVPYRMMPPQPCPPMPPQPYPPMPPHPYPPMPPHPYPPMPYPPMPCPPMPHPPRPCPPPRPYPCPPAADCIVHCCNLYPAQSMTNNGPIFGCAHVHPHGDEAVLAIAAWGLPDPCKLHDGKHYVAWAESHYKCERVSFRLTQDGELFHGHAHVKNICWVRMHITVEKEKDPDCPSEHVVMSTWMM